MNEVISFWTTKNKCCFGFYYCCCRCCIWSSFFCLAAKFIVIFKQHSVSDGTRQELVRNINLLNSRKWSIRCHAENLGKSPLEEISFCRNIATYLEIILKIWFTWQNQAFSLSNFNDFAALHKKSRILQLRFLCITTLISDKI